MEVSFIEMRKTAEEAGSWGEKMNSVLDLLNLKCLLNIPMEKLNKPLDT